jgi:hypothetical protein
MEMTNMHVFSREMLESHRLGGFVVLIVIRLYMDKIDNGLPLALYNLKLGFFLFLKLID